MLNTFKIYQIRYYLWRSVRLHALAKQLDTILYFGVNDDNYSPQFTNLYNSYVERAVDYEVALADIIRGMTR